MADQQKVVANLVRHIGSLHLENAHLDALHIEQKERANDLERHNKYLEGQTSSLEAECAVLRLQLNEARLKKPSRKASI